MLRRLVKKSFPESSGEFNEYIVQGNYKCSLISGKIQGDKKSSFTRGVLMRRKETINLVKSRDRGPLEFESHASEHEGDVMSIAKKTVVTAPQSCHH